MGPHLENPYYLLILFYLVHQSVMNIDSTRIHAPKLALQLFVWRRILKGIPTDNIEK